MTAAQAYAAAVDALLAEVEVALAAVKGDVAKRSDLVAAMAFQALEDGADSG